MVIDKEVCSELTFMYNDVLVHAVSLYSTCFFKVLYLQKRFFSYKYKYLFN